MQASKVVEPMVLIHFHISSIECSNLGFGIVGKIEGDDDDELTHGAPIFAPTKLNRLLLPSMYQGGAHFMIWGGRKGLLLAQ